MAMAPVTPSAAPDSIGYGTARDLAGMLDGIAAILKEEPQEQWDDPDLRAASEALHGHLWWRIHQPRSKAGGSS